MLEHLSPIHDVREPWPVAHPASAVLSIRVRRFLTVSSSAGPWFGHGAIRPHVVWFAEMPLFMAEIDAALAERGLFVSIGISGDLCPAAGFLDGACTGGANIVELDLEPSRGASPFAQGGHGPAATVVPAFVQRLLAR